MKIFKLACALFSVIVVTYLASIMIVNLGRVLTPWGVPVLQFVYGLFAFLFTGTACAFIVYLFGKAIAEIIPRKKPKEKTTEDLEASKDETEFFPGNDTCDKELLTGMQIVGSILREAEIDENTTSTSMYARHPSSRGEHLLIVRKDSLK